WRKTCVHLSNGISKGVSSINSKLSLNVLKRTIFSSYVWVTTLPSSFSRTGSFLSTVVVPIFRLLLQSSSGCSVTSSILRLKIRQILMMITIADKIQIRCLFISFTLSYDNFITSFSLFYIKIGENMMEVRQRMRRFRFFGIKDTIGMKGVAHVTKPIVNKILTGKVKQMGRPDAKDRMNRPWESGIFKNVADGKRWVGHEGFTDDEVADKKSHGGPHKALFAYPAKHYAY